MFSSNCGHNLVSSRSYPKIAIKILELQGFLKELLKANEDTRSLQILVSGNLSHGTCYIALPRSVRKIE